MPLSLNLHLFRLPLQPAAESVADFAAAVAVAAAFEPADFAFVCFAVFFAVVPAPAEPGPPAVAVAVVAL